MGKKSPQTVESPDPYEIAKADAEYNRIDQITPYGSLTYGGPNQSTATLTLTPELQSIFEGRQAIDQGMVSQALERLGGFDPNQIDLSQFGPIQSNIDRSGLGFQGLDLGNLPNVELANLFGFKGDLPNLQKSLDLSGLTEIPTDLNDYRSQVEDAYFQRSRRLMEPYFDRQETAMFDRLANQGLPQTSDAYLGEKGQFDYDRFNAMANVADQAVLQSGMETSRLLADALGARGQGFNELLGQATFGNQAEQQNFLNQLQALGFNNATEQQRFANEAGWRQQLFGEAAAETDYNNQATQMELMLRQQMLGNQNAGRTQALNESLGIRGNAFNELASLLGLQQVQTPQMQNFFAPGQVDVVGANQLGLQGQMFNANATNQMNAAGLGGLYGLGAAALTGGVGPGWLYGGGQSSDRRLKRNIKQIGTVGGYPWYSFEYIWGQKSEGVMSDEVPAKFVRKDRNGFDTVNYHALLTS